MNSYPDAILLYDVTTLDIRHNFLEKERGNKDEEIKKVKAARFRLGYSRFS